MYNRYIGNTGKYYRVDDDNNINNYTRQRPAPHDEGEPPLPAAIGLGSLQKSASRHPVHRSHPAESLKRILGGFMPKGTDIGDLLLILVLLLLYLEKEDEEILIILSVLIFNGFK